MHIVLGISATSDEVTAVLVDIELPRLGPVDERTTPMHTGSPAEVAEAVVTAIGVMRLRASRADLLVTDAAVVLDSPALREPVESALADGHVRDVVIVDAVDIDPSLEPAVAVALWADLDAGDATTGPIPVVLPEPVDTSTRERRRGFAVVGAGVAAVVLAASFAVWAATGSRVPEPAGVAEPLSTSAAESGDGIAPNPAAPAGSSSTAVPAPVSGDTPAADALTGVRPGVTRQNGAVSVPDAATPLPGTSSSAPTVGRSTSGGATRAGSTGSGSGSAGSGSTSGGAAGGGST
ncbi:hypothetical protein HQ313_13995, partial [Rhodococcus sp. BP-331]